MEILYLFSSPQGDVVLDPETLKRPFHLDPLQEHPFLVLEDFFSAIKEFMLQDQGRRLAGLLNRLWGQEVSIPSLEKLLIRYEKYGTLYQIASVETALKEKRIKFAVCAAFAEESKTILQHEYQTLSQLNIRYAGKHLPEAYWHDDRALKKEQGTVTIGFMLLEWFEGYQEWHLTGDQAPARAIAIWDADKGFRFAREEESREIIRQAAFTLTLYYDPDRFQQIHPWHHGAGDFVVQSDGDQVDVKLVSARGYTRAFFMEPDPDPMAMLISFFLDLTIRMRLDKSEGLGDPVWGPPWTVEAVLHGFYQALEQKEIQDPRHRHLAGKSIQTLKLMNDNQLQTWFKSRAEQYRCSDPVDFQVIDQQRYEHGRDVYRALQEFNP